MSDHNKDMKVRFTTSCEIEVYLNYDVEADDSDAETETFQVDDEVEFTVLDHPQSMIDGEFQDDEELGKLYGDDVLEMDGKPWHVPMNLTICNAICNECPFRKASLPGWLGDLTCEETLETQQYEGIFPCHKKRVDDPQENLERTLNGDMPICRGFIVSATLSCKRFGQNPQYGNALAELQDSIEITDDERENTLTQWDFREHHLQHFKRKL